jgi:hypothetical protein
VKRSLNIHEYQSQKLLKDFGLNTVRGTPVTSAEEAEKIAKAYYAFAGTLAPLSTPQHALVSHSSRHLGFHSFRSHIQMMQTWS